LISLKAAVIHRNTDGDTPLDYALQKVYDVRDFYGDRAKIVELLEAAGALTAAQLRLL